MKLPEEPVLSAVVRALTILAFGAFLPGCPGDSQQQTRNDVDNHFSNAPVGSTTAACPAAVPLVRFVDDGGNPATTSATVKNTLEVSNLVTTVQLPPGFTDASTDRDNFKVEVLDACATGNTIAANKVEVEARKRDHTAFSPRRKINVELQRVGTSNLFRSKYLRLVVDDADQAANPAQTVLTDWDPSDESVEILGQIVKVKYTAASGDVTAETTVGSANRSFVRVAVHVVRATAGGTPAVTTAQATTRIKKWYRRIMAQISMAPQLLLVREVDPLGNLISISNDHGRNATGGAASGISFRIRSTRSGAPDLVQNVGPYSPPAGATPMQTADALSALIRLPAIEADLLALLPSSLVSPATIAALRASAPFAVRTVQNPPTLEATITQGSADLIITDPAGGAVKIEALVQTDATQTVSVGVVTPTNFVGWNQPTSALNWVVGSIQQRTLLQAYDTGSDRIDLFVLDGPFFNTLRIGEAMIPGTIYAAGKQAIAAVTMSAFMTKVPMDGTDNYPINSAHEFGHVLLDAIHTTDNTQVMFDPQAPSNVVTAGKRFSETGVAFGMPALSIVQETRIRSLGASVLAPFV